MAPWWTLAGIAFGAALAWISGWLAELRRERVGQRRLGGALIGELLNIQQHYGFASVELPPQELDRSGVIQLELSQYGDTVFSPKTLSDIGFLSPNEILSIMQIYLVIRNNDMSIRHDIKQYNKMEELGSSHIYDRSLMARRMQYAQKLAASALGSIGTRYPDLIRRAQRERHV